MWSRKALVAIMMAAGVIGAGVAPAPSVAAVDIQLNFGPPAPRYEPAPPPRRGYVWEPGHWEWNGHRHVWVGGHWLQARPGYAYRAPRWVEHSGHWTYESSRWDRDGVANYRDPMPDGRRYSDRDRDGIPDYRDPTPDGPRADRGRDRAPDYRAPVPDASSPEMRGGTWVPQPGVEYKGIPGADRDHDTVPDVYDARPDDRRRH